MKKQSKLRRYWLITLVFMFIITLSFYIALQSADFRELEQGNSIILKAEDFSPSFNAYNYKTPGQQFHTYEITVLKDSFKSEQDYTLIIHRLADNAHKVYFNDYLIGRRGDYTNANSNLWNSLSYYPIGEELIEESNQIRIETTSTYRTGLSYAPIYIVSQEKGEKYIGQVMFFGEQINTIAIGFIIFSSVISLLFYYIAGKGDKKYIFIAIATILTGVYYSDYISYDFIGIPYLIYKKLTIGSLFFGIAFYSYVVSHYFNKKWLEILGHITMVGTLIIIIVAPNMVIFKQMYTYWYLALLLNIVCWIIVSITQIRKRLAAYIFFISFLTIGLYGGTIALMDIFGEYFRFNSPVVYIIIFAVVPLLLIYVSVQEQEMLLVKERSLREEDFLKSVTDNLTGIWNQRYMSMLTSEQLGSYSMAIVDVDNFKLINDTYGHQAGDYVLTTIANILSERIRKSDIVCRYGGDEFVVIMKDCSKEEAYTLLESVRAKVEEERFDYKGQSIDGSISIGLMEEKKGREIDVVFNQADQLLYKAKAAGKNKIVM